MTAEFITTERVVLRPPEAAPGRGQAHAVLDRLWARGREFLGTELAIMGGAMTWVSERNLVAAISNTGGFGVIASGSMSPDLLSAEIAATAALTERPFGVNLITMHPQLMALIDVSLEHRVGHVVLAGGMGTAEGDGDTVYLAMSVRNPGNGIAVMRAWRVWPERLTGEQRPELSGFRRQTRDLYVAPADTGFWQAALRDPDDPERGGVAEAVKV